MRSLGSKIAVLLLSGLLSLVALEAASMLVYSHFNGRPFSRIEIQGRLLADRVGGQLLQGAPAELKQKLQDLRDASVPDPPVIIHPYFGFVANPNSPGVNKYGFFQDPPLRQRTADTAIVAIFGGSLADQVFYMAQDTLIEELERSGIFAGRRIDVVSTALGGYRQPQQLLLLAYLLSRGANYDVVINIDGFNELDTSLDNWNEGINPFFPHNWKLHATRGLDPEAVKQLGKLELVRERRRRLKELFARAPLRNSAFFLTLWDALDRRQEARRRNVGRELQRILAQRHLPPRAVGPHLGYGTDQPLYGDIADLWERSSFSMAALCRSRAIQYFHFLQPNQYVPDSKPFTAEELEHAYDLEWAGAERIPVGYPLLLERGQGLRRRGVNFGDLTGVFANERRSVYSDFCCHVNQLGADLIAREVARVISERLGGAGNRGPERTRSDVDPRGLAARTDDES
jgi:hypothetical protein